MSFRGAPAQRSTHAEAERVILGAILANNALAAEAAEQLVSAHFQREAHRSIFRAMLILFERGDPIDPVTLGGELRRMEALEAVGGVVYLASLIDGLPRVTALGAWIEIVLERARRREALRLVTKAAADAQDEAQAPDDVIGQLQSSLTKLLESTNGRTVFPVSAVLKEALSQVETFATSASGLVGASTGFPDLDRATAGMEPGHLWVIAARPSRGKSSLMAQIAATLARGSRRVLVYSTEMRPVDVARRMLLSEARVDRWALRQRQEDADWQRLAFAYAQIERLGDRLLFDSRPQPSVSQIVATAKQIKARQGLDAIVVDHALRLALAGGPDRWARIGDNVVTLKSLAVQIQVPLLLMWQIAATAEEKRPTAGDLAQCKQIVEAEANVLGFLHPDDPAHWREQAFPGFTLHLDKVRDGETGPVRLSFERRWTRFESAAREDA